MLKESGLETGDRTNVLTDRTWKQDVHGQKIRFYYDVEKQEVTSVDWNGVA